MPQHPAKIAYCKRKKSEGMKQFNRYMTERERELAGAMLIALRQSNEVDRQRIVDAIENAQIQCV